MDPILRVIVDVAGLVTRGSDAARMETHRMAAERERWAEGMAHRRALHPTAILAVGNAESPVERLMGLRSAVAKAVQFAVAVGRVRPRLPRISLLRYRMR